jgi:hypothetical protein
MSYVLLPTISLVKLTQPVQVYRHANSSPQEPRHGVPPPLQYLHSFPCQPTPTFHSICGKERSRKQYLSYQEGASRVEFCHLSHKSGQRQSFPSCNSSLKGTTEQMPSCLPRWFPSCSTHSPRTTGQARSIGNSRRAGTVAFLERRMIRPCMAELVQTAGFSSVHHYESCITRILCSVYNIMNYSG